MRRFLMAGLALQLLAVPCFAQTTVSPGSSGGSTSRGTAGGFGSAAAATTNGPATGPATGANSFTEDQAKRRLEHNGYNHVSGLTEDNNGIWHGSATKNGSSVQVSVDFKGKISTN